MLHVTVNEVQASGGFLPGLGDLERDLQLASDVQRQMLPRETKQMTTVKYSGTTIATRGIGGDYYDFLDLGPGTLGVILADVSGKGVAAALLMANLQACIRCECSHESTDLAAMLRRVNAHFLGSTLPEQYATLLFGRYDDRTRQMEYVNCGQQPAMIVRASGTIERLETTALPLGLVRNWTGEANSVELGRSDTLFVCSDGVIEAGVDKGCEFGEDGLMSVLATNPPDVELAIARVANAARTYGATDDMTIVGMRSV
jgi:sigma-B regulation protein RsbU (phosphoserine phosphatase)